MTAANQSLANLSNTTFPTGFVPTTTAPNQSSYGNVSNIQFTSDRIITIFSLSIFIPCIIAGNLLVITAVLKTRQLRTVTNIFVVSLAVTDVLVGAISAPIYMAFTIRGQIWFAVNFPNMQRLWSAVDMITGVTSIINLMNISIDRYICIHYPFRYQRLMSLRKALLLATFSWCYGLASYFLNFRQDTLDHTSYILVLTVVAYLIPLFVIILAYLSIARVAGKQAKKIKRLRNDAGKNTLTSFLKEIKAARVLAVVVGAFVLCWSGTFIMNLKFVICKYCSSCHCSVPSEETINVVKMLQYFSSVVNPFIYTSLNKDFRKAIKKLVLGSRQRRASENSHTTSVKYTVQTTEGSDQAARLHPVE